ncbi:glycerophosphoinositol permease [Xenotaenia resolanae]|uniref:Glycerophosphoinositol permease n=1 Tax=Xenotaenia resolanae TaxID=208358 RepID=A0ABV0W794_9TELE
MVQTLNSNGANSIWEHSLLDPASVMSGKRKANPQDKLLPNKSEFIRAKYQMLAFVHRVPCRDDDSSTAKDLSKQLHSSVRTGNLETCLRLLSLGAQANFFHPEKGNTPLHVATRAGQVSQAELLTVYGADPGALDNNGKTPIDYAREVGHYDLADRLVEVQYELTDRLAFYLCGRKPGKRPVAYHWCSHLYKCRFNRTRKSSKEKAAVCNNHLFEELAMDVYDEVDRRETDAGLLSERCSYTHLCHLYLIVCSVVGHTESQHLGDRDYSGPLPSCKSRVFINKKPGKSALQRSLQVLLLCSAFYCKFKLDNVELILKGVAVRHSSDYDSVASDEDTDQELPSSKGDRTKFPPQSLDSDLSDGPITMHEYMEVKTALTASEAKIQQLLKANDNLNDELRLMQKKVTTNVYQTPSSTDYPDPSSPSALKRRQSAQASRPMSMYETGSGLKPYLSKGETPYPEEGLPSLQPFSPHVSKTSSLLSFAASSPLLISTSKLEKQSSVPESDYDNTFNDSEMDDSGFGRRGRLRSSGWLGEGSSIPELDDLEMEPDPTLPSTEDVIRKTEQITKNIQELLRAAQDNKHDSFLPCSERIHVAVTEMAALFPKRPRSETVRGSLRLLTTSACRLQNECRKAAPLDGCSGPDMQLVTQQVIQCAYDIAKAAKQLVTITTKENTN